MENTTVLYNNFVLGIDIGGTGIKAAPVDIIRGKLLQESYYLRTPNPPTPDAILEVIKNIILKFNWKNNLGCGFPGVISKGKVLTAVNLSDEWLGVNIEKEIQKFSPAKVSVINDADAAGIAEMSFGAGKQYNRHGGGVVLVVTLGTGIGSALFVEGHLACNTELGHIEIDGIDAEQCAATVVMKNENLSWQEWGLRVGKYLKTVENLIFPKAFIIGGGVSESSEKFLKFIKVRARVLPARMNNDAGIIGAAITAHAQAGA